MKTKIRNAATVIGSIVALAIAVPVLAQYDDFVSYGDWAFSRQDREAYVYGELPASSGNSVFGTMLYVKCSRSGETYEFKVGDEANDMLRRNRRGWSLTARGQAGGSQFNHALPIRISTPTGSEDFPDGDMMTTLAFGPNPAFTSSLRNASSFRLVLSNGSRTYGFVIPSRGSNAAIGALRCG